MIPGQDRVIRVTVRGHEFGYRRPSRGDLDAIARRYAQKLIPASGSGLESDLIAGAEGDALQWEARFEVSLIPRRKRDNTELDLGETAPKHWFEDGAIDFGNVDDEEFWAVVEAITEALAPPGNPPPPGNSGSSAGGANNG